MKELIEALQIMAKYMDGDVSHPTCCSHDVLYVPTVDFDKVSEEDKRRLQDLGFRYNSDGDQGFMSHKFGSC